MNGKDEKEVEEKNEREREKGKVRREGKWERERWKGRSWEVKKKVKEIWKISPNLFNGNNINSAASRSRHLVS